MSSLPRIFTRLLFLAQATCTVSLHLIRLPNAVSANQQAAAEAVRPCIQRRDLLLQSLWTGIAVSAVPFHASAALDQAALQGIRREGESERQYRGRQLAALKQPPRRLTPSGKLTDGAIPEIKSFPKLDNLAPLYEMAVGVAMISKAASDPDTWSDVSEALERIFAGGFFNLRNLYLGLAVQYVGGIQYVDPDKKLVEADVEVRLFAINQCFDLLKSASKLLGERNASPATVDTSLTSPPAEVQLQLSLRALLSSADASMRSFLAMTPMENIQQVEDFERMLLTIRIDPTSSTTIPVPVPDVFANDKELRDAFLFISELRATDKSFLQTNGALASGGLLPTA